MRRDTCTATIVSLGRFLLSCPMSLSFFILSFAMQQSSCSFFSTVKALRLQLLHTCDGSPLLSVNATRNIGPKRPRRLACFASTVNKLVVCFASSSERQKRQRYHRYYRYRSMAILQSHLAARRGRIFSTYFSVNCLLHISINYTESVMDLYAHAQTVDTRRSSPIFQAPGYEAMVRLDVLCYLLHDNM